jgi:phage-related protein
MTFVFVLFPFSSNDIKLITENKSLKENNEKLRKKLRNLNKAKEKKQNELGKQVGELNTSKFDFFLNHVFFFFNFREQKVVLGTLMRWTNRVLSGQNFCVWTKTNYC